MGGWVGALISLASSAYGAAQSRKGRQAAQAMRPVVQAPLATESGEGAEAAKRAAQRAAAKKKGLQASILAGDTGAKGGGPWAKSAHGSGGGL